MHRKKYEAIFFSISGRKNYFFDRMTFFGSTDPGGTSLLGVRMPISVENAPTSTGDISAGNGSCGTVGTDLESPGCVESKKIWIGWVSCTCGGAGGARVRPKLSRRFSTIFYFSP